MEVLFNLKSHGMNAPKLAFGRFRRDSTPNTTLKRLPVT